MIVYRYVSQAELDLILSGNITCLGNANCCADFSYCNTHKYKSGVKYLHFFRNEKILYVLQKDYKSAEGNYYICKFDIPLVVLLSGVGFGYYDCSGYTMDFEKLLEFAIKTDRIKPEWFKGYKLDEKHAQNLNI